MQILDRSPCMKSRYFIKAGRVSSFLLIIVMLASGATFPGLANEEVSLSVSEKRAVFSKVWNLINERYYDPNMNGVDWGKVRATYAPLVPGTKTDREFYDVVKKMVSEMNDAHTRFLTPLEARQRRAREGTTSGILLSRVEGKTVVERVLPNAQGELQRVKPGMEVRTIDGVPVEQRVAEAKKEIVGSSSARALEIMSYRRVLRGAPGTSVKVGLTDHNGTEFEVTLTRRVVSERSEAIGRVLPSGLGYIAITSFKAPISGKFRKTLESLKDTPAMIIDLRYNGGGSINEVLIMAGMFLDRKYNFGKFVRRAGSKRQSLRKFSAGGRNTQVYSKPVIILTSKFSASGSELFASSLQELGRARVVGTQTCGCLLGISRKHRLRGGSELHISDIGFISAKGRIYEKIGVTPDQISPISIVDLASGTDGGVAMAERMLNDSAAEN